MLTEHYSRECLECPMKQAPCPWESSWRSLSVCSLRCPRLQDVNIVLGYYVNHCTHTLGNIHDESIRDAAGIINYRSSHHFRCHSYTPRITHIEHSRIEAWKNGKSMPFHTYALLHWLNVMDVRTIPSKSNTCDSSGNHSSILQFYCDGLVTQLQSTQKTMHLNVRF